jgi:hypothetical protein
VEHAVYSPDGLTNSSHLDFTGTVTVTPWTVGGNGNLVAPDPAAPPATGWLTQTTDQTTQEGQYGTFNSNLDFSGVTTNGNPFSFKEEFHATVPPSPKEAPKVFEIASCG